MKCLSVDIESVLKDVQYNWKYKYIITTLIEPEFLSSNPFRQEHNIVYYD